MPTPGSESRRRPQDSRERGRGGGPSLKLLRSVVLLIIFATLLWLFTLWNFRVRVSEAGARRATEGGTIVRAIVSSGSKEVSPVLATRHYALHRPGNAKWQEAEREREYPGAALHAQHGDLFIGANTESFKVPLRRNVTDLRSGECRQQAGDATGFRFRGARPSQELVCVSVVLIFCNEVLELLLRSIYSILDRTPPFLLREILLVDDASTDEDLLPRRLGGTGALEEYLHQLPKVRYTRLDKRAGIVGARKKGFDEAEGDAVMILDSHVEVGHQWLEPLALRISTDPKSVVMPFIDGISHSYEPQAGGIGCVLGFLWKTVEHAYHPTMRNPSRGSKKSHEFITSPVMAGGLFAAHREFFLDLGGYDPGMRYWGAENLELSFRLWQCGGRLECTECSRVYHLFGSARRYSTGYASLVTNKLRTAAVWMDGYGDLAWRVLGTPPLEEPLEGIEERLRLRHDLRCRDFRWFMRNVYPEADVVDLSEDVPYLGFVKHVPSNSCLHGNGVISCADARMQLMYFRIPQHVHPVSNDELCLTSEDDRTRVRWDTCVTGPIPSQQWEVIEGNIVTQSQPKMCITITRKDLTASNGTDPTVTLSRCHSGWANQTWEWAFYKGGPPLWQQAGKSASA